MKNRRNRTEERNERKSKERNEKQEDEQNIIEIIFCTQCNTNINLRHVFANFIHNGICN